MKKIWKCPNCTQISTRHWNLKRHIERKHRAGQTNLTYISGNSTFNFSDPVTPPYSYYVNYQNEPYRNMRINDILHPVTQYTKNNYYREDKWFDLFCRMYELQLMDNQSSNMNPVQYYPQPPTQFYGALTGDPINTGFKEIQDKHARNLDGVIGYKIEICEKCLTTLTFDIGRSTEYWRIQDVHKCEPATLAATKSLDPAQYSFNLLTKLTKIPELLFEKFNEWANNTTGMLYLIARPFESLDKYEQVQIPQN